MRTTGLPDPVSYFCSESVPGPVTNSNRDCYAWDDIPESLVVLARRHGVHVLNVAGQRSVDAPAGVSSALHIWNMSRTAPPLTFVKEYVSASTAAEDDTGVCSDLREYAAVKLLHFQNSGIRVMRDCRITYADRRVHGEKIK